MSDYLSAFQFQQQQCFSLAYREQGPGKKPMVISLMTSCYYVEMCRETAMLQMVHNGPSLKGTMPPGTMMFAGHPVIVIAICPCMECNDGTISSGVISKAFPFKEGLDFIAARIPALVPFLEQ